jgi:hypothetical protein
MTSESSTPKPSRIFLPGIALLKRLGKNARFWVIPAPLVLALCVLFSMHLTELLTDDSSAATPSVAVASHILVPLLVSLTGLLLWLYLLLCFLRTNASMSGRTEETIRMAADGDLTGKPEGCPE